MIPKRVNLKKHLVQLCAIIIGVILLNSCENEQIEESIVTSQTLPINTAITVDKSEIPNVVDFLQNQTKNGLEIKLSSKSNTSYTGELDLESIKAIIHEQGSETYTFNIKDQNRYQSFSNLHASIRDGKLYTYILTYEFDQSFYDHFDFTRYSGTITLSNLEGEILNISTLEEGSQVNTLAKTHYDCSTVTFSGESVEDCTCNGSSDGPTYVYTHCESILDSTGGLPWNNCMSCNDSPNGPGPNYNNTNNGVGSNGSGIYEGGLGDNQLSNAIIYDGRFIDNLSNVLGRPIGLAESGWIFSSQENYAVATEIASLIGRDNLFTGTTNPEVIALGNTILDACVANELTTFQAAVILNLIKENGNSEEVVREATLTIQSLSNVTPWQSASGMIDGNNNLAYNQTRVWSINGENITEFKLLNGDRVARGNYSICSGCQGNEDKTFYRQKESPEWFEFVSRPSTFNASDLDFVFDAFWDGAKFVGRWIMPVEDVMILVGGTNFEGESENQYLAGGMLLVSVIPGAKLLKPVKKVITGTNTWRVVSRAGIKIAEASYDRFVNAVQDGVISKIDDLFRSGDVAVDVLEETAEVIIDLSESRGRKFSWEEIKALFKRGNDFNKKAVDSEWYDFHEIHLSNGKRLDSYDPITGEIISRKATDLGKIKFSTFENYLKEMQQKYASGTRIRSNKYPDLDGSLLQGQQILEIPASNQSLSNIQTFINFARDNYNIIIRFRPE